MDSDVPGDLSFDEPVTPSYLVLSVYGLLIANVLALGFGIGFFVYGGIFAPLSDAAALLVGALFAPVIWWFNRVTKTHPSGRSIYFIGIGAVATVVAGSLGLLVSQWLMLEELGPIFLGIQFVGTFLEGAWLVGMGTIALQTDALRSRTSWAAIIGGVGSIVGTFSLVYSYTVSSLFTVVTIAGLLYAVGVTLWTFWLGRELRNRVDARR